MIRPYLPRVLRNPFVRKLIFATLIAAALLLALISVQTVIAQTPTVSVVPESATVSTDASSFQVNFYVNQVTNEMGLGGYDIYVHFDPTIIQAVSGQDSGFLQDENNTENIVVCVPPYIDNSGGWLILSCLTVQLFVGNGPTVTSQQLLATAVFRPVATGTSALALDSTTLSDPNGVPLQATLQSSQVAIVQPTQPTTESPTSTPVPDEPTATVEATALPAATDTPAGAASPIAQTATPTRMAVATTPRAVPKTGDGAADDGSSTPMLLIAGVVGIVVVGSAGAGAFVWKRRRANRTG